MYDQTTRVKGGSSFADAMFRQSASTDEYVKAMANRKFKGSGNYIVHKHKDSFTIKRDGVTIMVFGMQMVEKMRSEGVRVFEEWIVSAAKNAGEDGNL